MANLLRRRKVRSMVNPLLVMMVEKTIPPTKGSMRRIHLREYSALSQFQRNEADEFHLKELMIATHVAGVCSNKLEYTGAAEEIKRAAAIINRVNAEGQKPGGKYQMTPEEVEFFESFFNTIEDMRQSMTVFEYNQVVDKVNEILRERNAAREAEEKAKGSEAP